MKKFIPLWIVAVLTAGFWFTNLSLGKQPQESYWILAACFFFAMSVISTAIVMCNPK